MAVSEIWLAVDAEPVPPDQKRPDQVDWHWGDRSLALAIDAIATVSGFPVRVVPVADAQSPLPPDRNAVTVLPLSLNVPPTLLDPALGEVLTKCRDRAQFRTWVEDTLDVATGDGFWWLPIALTAKGPLYGEAIAFDGQRNGFAQPWHLSDAERQPAYRTGLQLLQALDAPPSVYLLQFSLDGRGRMVVDRLYPFPARPALASHGVQKPDLFACYWTCTLGARLRDLVILG